MHVTDRYFIITGGPGSGKTTLIDSLRAEGFATSAEVGRRIIQEQVAAGGDALPWADREKFAALMLAAEMRSYEEHRAGDGPAIFDRGVPDVIGYLRLCGLPVPAAADTAAKNYRYNRTVLICPPWREIFAQDAERKQDFAEAERTYEAMVETYADLGYELIRVPIGSTAKRSTFVTQKINAAAKG